MDRLSEGFLPVENARLFYRDVGHGPTVIVLHGGPDFDMSYFLPDMDRLADSCRFVYYDQRGRGRSADGVRPADVTMPSEMADLDAVRHHFGFDTMSVLGHSWGGLLAMEYAIRHPGRVSHLILMNTAPASFNDYRALRDELQERRTPREREWNRIRASSEFREGDPDAVTAMYRIHFGTTVRSPELLETLLERLRVSFTRESVLKSRAIEDRLYRETVDRPDYDLCPDLERLHVPTLILHGEHDFVPLECVERIARAIPGARFHLMSDCGHFSYMESPEAVTREVRQFLEG